jgi:patatin-like phospholipase/acyl hydrolase
MEHVDLIAGTSTGGFNALALASGWSPDEALQAYEITGWQIFSNNKRRVVSGLAGACRAKYGQSGKALALHLMFGDKRLSDLRKHGTWCRGVLGMCTDSSSLNHPTAISTISRDTSAARR